MPFAPDGPLVDGGVCSKPEPRVRPRSRRTGFAWTDDRLHEHVDFALARGIQSFDAAFRLVHDEYVSRGYMKPLRSGRRLSVRHALPTTRVFVAQVGCEVVGTMTLIQDSLLGLPMDDLYRAELARLREDGRLVAEVSALAMHPSYRSAGPAILLRLIRMLALYAVEVARLDDLCIAVLPRHAAFYREFFDFEPFGGQTTYARINWTPAVGLRLDLHLVRAIIDRVQGGEGGQDVVHHFLYGAGNYQQVMDRLLRSLCEPALTREWFSYFFPDEAAFDGVEPSAGLERLRAFSRAGPPG
jgi:hypothetical protein